VLKECVAGVVLMGIGFSSAVGQTPRAASRQSVPDFDIRETQTTPDRSRDDLAAAAIAERRSQALLSFTRTPEESRLGTRITPNKFGLPKLYLRDGRTLTAPSQSAATEVAKGFLRAQTNVFALTNAEIDGLRLLVDDETEKARFVAFNQTVNGIDVFNGQIKFTLSKNGEIIQVATGAVVPGLNLSSTPSLSAESAVKAASAAVGRPLTSTLTTIPRADNTIAFANPRGGTYSPITSELTVFPMNASSARLAYRILLEVDQQNWYELLVDAQTGGLLFRHNLYVHSGQARVWSENPSVGSQSLVTFPDGWLPANGTVTTGNNVDAYLDTDGNDVPDNVTNSSMQNGRALSSSQVFDFPFGDGTVALDPRLHQPAAVTHLFYFINIAHDYYYSLGFNEAAGNFQTDNLGKGGVGNDAVLAEAQNPLLVNDAAFSPTPEGTAPKIRMGLFTRNTSVLTDDLDSDYDGQVIIHEYGHGVSNRLVGAKTSTSCLQKIQSGAMGEGWSDYFSISYFNDPVEGRYIGQNPISGIRRYSYEGYPLTYEDIGNSSIGYEVHNDGEIWAGTLWDLRKSLGQATTDQLAIDGLKSTPCNPSMTDARDAIISADQADNNGTNRKTIWTIFAKHGLGYSALGVDGTSATGTRYDAAYDLPPDLQTTPNPAITSNPLSIFSSDGDLYKYTVTASNPESGMLTYALSSGPAGMTVDGPTGLVAWTAGFTGQRVKITVTDGLGGKVVHGYLLPIVTLLNSAAGIPISGDQNSIGYAAFIVPQNAPAVWQLTTRGGIGDVDLEVIGPDGSLSISEREGNNETLSFPNPKPGIWFIYGLGYMTYSDVSLTASMITPAVISGNTILPGLTGISGSETYYRIPVPAGANLSIKTAGGTGDVDLFLEKGVPPTCQEDPSVFAACSFDQASFNDGNIEAISITNPAAADWYLDLNGFLDYSGVTMTVTVTFPPLTVPSGGAVHTTTPDTASTVSAGYATASVASGPTPFATAVFSLTQNGVVVSEAGIPASPPTTSARLFIDYRTGVSSGTGTLNIRTGLAMVNPGTTSAPLTFILRDVNGQTITTGHATLAAGAHRSLYIDELSTMAPDFNLPSAFSTSTLYGSLEVSSPSQAISVLALRLTTNQRGDTLLTSTPVADLTKAQSTSPVYFPQLADGGGFTTSLVLLNTSSSTEAGTVAFFDNSGSALSIRPVGGTAGSSFLYSIPASGFFVLQTDGSGTSVQIGSVQVTPNAGANAPVGAGIFSSSIQGILVTESGVPSAQPTTKARIYIDRSGGHDTGIAIANPGSSAATVNIQAYLTDGVTTAGNTPQPFNLAASGHMAKFADELISALPNNFTGVAEITSQTPFVALTLRSLINSRGDTLLTTFPVADENQSAPSPIIFPQMADGGGFATQFIFISASGPASVNVNFFGDDGSGLALGQNP
jgi:hypothetical protein